MDDESAAVEVAAEQYIDAMALIRAGDRLSAEITDEDTGLYVSGDAENKLATLAREAANPAGVLYALAHLAGILVGRLSVEYDCDPEAILAELDEDVARVAFSPDDDEEESE